MYLSYNKYVFIYIYLNINKSETVGPYTLGPVCTIFINKQYGTPTFYNYDSMASVFLLLKHSDSWHYK